MIKFILDPSVFEVGGIFYNVPPNRAVLNLGDAVPWGGYIGKLKPPYAASNFQYRGGQTQFEVDWTGFEVSDLQMQAFVQSDNFNSMYGIVIVDFVTRGILQVQHNGTPLTPTQISTFTA